MKKHEWLYSVLHVPLGAGASEPQRNRACHWFLEQHVCERPSVQLVTFFHLEPQLPRFFQALRGRCSQHHGQDAAVHCDLSPTQHYASNTNPGSRRPLLKVEMWWQVSSSRGCNCDTIYR